MKIRYRINATFDDKVHKRCLNGNGCRAKLKTDLTHTTIMDVKKSWQKMSLANKFKQKKLLANSVLAKRKLANSVLAKKSLVNCDLAKKILAKNATGK